MDLIEIDGSVGEGGGQIIRTALSLSAITKRPIHVFNIRPNRKPKPHLRPQHLMAAQAAAKVCGGHLHGADIGATSFVFHPNEIQSGDYEFDIKTAGSAILVAQTLIPILIHAKGDSLIRIRGGTALPKSPSYDYFENVFLPAIFQFGCEITPKLQQSGYFPVGNGLVEIEISPTKLTGHTDWSTSSSPHAKIRVANLPRSIAEREMIILKEAGIVAAEIIEELASSKGNSILIWQGYKGGSSLGLPGKLAEKVAQEAFDDFQHEQAEVDQHLADQLLLYAALAEGETKYKTSTATKHLLTNRLVISKFIDREVQIKECANGYQICL